MFLSSSYFYIHHLGEINPKETPVFSTFSPDCSRDFSPQVSLLREELSHQGARVQVNTSHQCEVHLQYRASQPVGYS